LTLEALCFIYGSGWGTDEQAVISILAHRDAIQRKQIALEYEHKYSESLIQRLQSELSGDFEVLPVQLAAVQISLHAYFCQFSSPGRTSNNVLGYDPAESSVPLDA
jgi:hypothetical protein